MKISEAFDLYKNNYMFIKKKAPRQLESHELLKKRLIQSVGDLNIRKLNMDHISQWLRDNSTYHTKTGEERLRCQNYIRNDLIHIRVVLRYAKDCGHRCMNPSMIPVPKKEEKARCFLSPEEVASMIEHAHSLRNKVVISLLYSSGIRLSEMIALNRDDIKNGSFTVVGKGQKVRLCFIDERTEQLLDEYLRRRHDDCEALIISYKNLARMTPTNVQLLVKNSARRAGIKKHVTPHVLRHSFATNFINNNGNIRHLSSLLGHSSVDTTMTYTHIVDNELRSQYLKFHSV